MHASLLPGPPPISWVPPSKPEGRQIGCRSELGIN